MFESAHQLNLKLWLSRLFRREVLSVCLCVAGLSLSWYSYSSLLSSQNGGSGVGVETVAAEGLEASMVPVILVEAAGMVKNPGVYQVAATARAGDVIEKAGGLSKEADQSYVSKDLNLAAAVKDGQKIYIPYEGELTIDEDRGLASGANTTTPTNFGGNLISINSASLSELQNLKGIGEVRAEAIAAGRPYTSIDDLVEKEVLGATVFDEIKTRLTL